MHQPVGGKRVFPCEGFVDALGVAVFINAQVFGAARVTQVRAVERRAGGYGVVRLGVVIHRFRVRWLEAEAARNLDRAEQDLQDVQGARGLEAVGVGRDAAHGVHGHGAADHLLVLFAFPVGPRDVEGDFFLESHASQLCGDGADTVGGDAHTLGHGIGGVFVGQVFLGENFESGAALHAVHFDHAAHGGLGTGGFIGHGLAGGAVPDQLLAVCVAHKQAVLVRALNLIHEERHVGVADQVVEIDLAGFQQFVDQRQDEQSIGAGGDAYPFIGNCVIARADRVHADDLGTVGFKLAKADFDRVGIVVLSNAENHKQFCAVPIRRAEFPEGPAHGIDAASGHIDRAETAVGGVIQGAEILRPPACHGLGLVTTREKRKLFGVFLANRVQEAGGNFKRLFPRDILELAFATLADPLHRIAQARGGIMLHNASGTFGAKHTLIDRVVLVAFDILDLAVLHVDIDPATAGTHITCGAADLVADNWRGVQLWLMMLCHTSPKDYRPEFRAV